MYRSAPGIVDLQNQYLHQKVHHHPPHINIWLWTVSVLLWPMANIDLHGGNLSASDQVKGSTSLSETVSEILKVFIFRNIVRVRVYQLRVWTDIPTSSDPLSQLWLINIQLRLRESPPTIDLSLDLLQHHQDVRTGMESCVCVCVCVCVADQEEKDMCCMRPAGAPRRGCDYWWWHPDGPSGWPGWQ